MRKSLLGFALLFFAPALVAQNPPRGGRFSPALSHEVIASSRLDNPALGEEDLKIGVSKTALRMPGPPLFVRAGTVITQYLSYEDLDIDYSRNLASPVPVEPDHLTGLAYGLNMVFPLRKAWRVVGMARTGLYADKIGLRSEDLKTGGGLFCVWSPRPQISLGGGLSYTYEFGDPRLLAFPFIKLQSASERWQFDFTPPYNVSLWYRPKRPLSVGLLSQVDGGRYRLHNSSQLTDYSLNYSRTVVGLGLRYNPMDVLQLQVDAGTTVRRKFRLVQGTDIIRNNELKNAPYLRITLSLKR
ncbi:MAG: DUF6268 family outer membrane beta-barrel protein [Elusimicrobia bacterium]|nr:DUF6268 family outer membrane beta-barrel protein [Candidatus Obscuribacterium magneticum]